MKVVKYNNIKQLTKAVMETSEKYDVSVIAHYEYIVSLFEELIRNGCIVYSVGICHPEFDCYDKEYILSVTPDGVFVEKMWRTGVKNKKDGYLDDYSEVTYIHQDCNSNVLKHAKADTRYEFSIKEYDEAECECCDCECKDEDDSMNGFTADYADEFGYHRLSFYSTNEKHVTDMEKFMTKLFEKYNLMELK